MQGRGIMTAERLLLSTLRGGHMACTEKRIADYVPAHSPRAKLSSAVLQGIGRASHTPRRERKAGDQPYE